MYGDIEDHKLFKNIWIHTWRHIVMDADGVDETGQSGMGKGRSVTDICYNCLEFWAWTVVTRCSMSFECLTSRALSLSVCVSVSPNQKKKRIDTVLTDIHCMWFETGNIVQILDSDGIFCFLIGLNFSHARWVTVGYSGLCYRVLCNVFKALINSPFVCVNNHFLFFLSFFVFFFWGTLKMNKL